MSPSVQFVVEISNHLDKYGITLWVGDEDDDLDDDDTLPCYRLLFQGPPGTDEEEMAKMFGECHQEAMTSVGIEGEISPELFEEKLQDAIEVAGSLMVRYGYRNLNFEDVDEEIIEKLWDEYDDDFDPEDSSSQNKLLN